MAWEETTNIHGLMSQPQSRASMGEVGGDSGPGGWLERSTRDKHVTRHDSNPDPTWEDLQ